MTTPCPTCSGLGVEMIFREKSGTETNVAPTCARCGGTKVDLSRLSVDELNRRLGAANQDSSEFAALEREARRRSR